MATDRLGGHCGGVDLNDAAAHLYGLDPAEFTAARNALAKGASGGVAAAIETLRKPTPPAWCANQLVRLVPVTAAGTQVPAHPVTQRALVDAQLSRHLRRASAIAVPP